MGMNEAEYKGQTDFFSCASCPTNGLAPLVKCVNDKWGIEEGILVMTKIHALPATQAVVHSPSTFDCSADS
jgi:glyceraldehyde 3-phosphate dehydrogenase